MLPFLEPKKMAGIVMMKMKNNSSEAEKEEGEPMPEMLAAAEDILSAIAMKDAKALADALHAAFMIADSMPHEEGEHMEEEEEME
jgi:galactokinase/mevalonate kinase-like predicted kinase